MKKMFITLAAVLILSLPMAAYAVNSNQTTGGQLRGFCGYGSSTANLTDKQKADLNEAFSKMISLKKETVSKMVLDGLITKEQGDLELKRIDDIVKYHNENGTGYGYGMMGGKGYGKGLGGGCRMMGGY